MPGIGSQDIGSRLRWLVHCSQGILFHSYRSLFRHMSYSSYLCFRFICSNRHLKSDILFFYPRFIRTFFFYPRFMQTKHDGTTAILKARSQTARGGVWWFQIQFVVPQDYFHLNTDPEKWIGQLFSPHQRSLRKRDTQNTQNIQYLHFIPSTLLGTIGESCSATLAIIDS